MDNTNQHVILAHEIKNGWYILEAMQVTNDRRLKHYYAYHMRMGSLETANPAVIDEYINLTRKNASDAKNN